MNPVLPRLILALVATVLGVTACGSGGGGAPAMPEAYRDRLTEAWQSAGRGENPIQACAIVTGLAVGRSHQAGGGQNSDAARAFEVCYVDIPARYIETRVSGGNADQVCSTIATFLVTARMSLGGFAADLGIDRANLDAKVNQRIGDVVRRNCGDQAEAILGS